MVRCAVPGYIVHQAEWRLRISWIHFKLEQTPVGLYVTSFGFLQFKSVARFVWFLLVGAGALGFVSYTCVGFFPLA